MEQAIQPYPKRRRRDDTEFEEVATPTELIWNDRSQTFRNQEVGATYGSTTTSDNGFGILGNVYDSQIHIHHHHHVNLPPLLNDPILRRIAQTQLAILRDEAVRSESSQDIPLTVGQSTTHNVPVDVARPVAKISPETNSWSIGSQTDASQRLASLEAGLTESSMLETFTESLNGMVEALQTLDQGPSCDESVSDATFVTCLDTVDYDRQTLLLDQQGNLAFQASSRRRYHHDIKPENIIIAVIGETGAGKSIFLQQITRTHDQRRHETRYDVAWRCRIQDEIWGFLCKETKAKLDYFSGTEPWTESASRSF